MFFEPVIKLPTTHHLYTIGLFCANIKARVVYQHPDYPKEDALI